MLMLLIIYLCLDLAFAAEVKLRLDHDSEDDGLSVFSFKCSVDDYEDSHLVSISIYRQEFSTGGGVTDPRELVAYIKAQTPETPKAGPEYQRIDVKGNIEFESDPTAFLEAIFTDLHVDDLGLYICEAALVDEDGKIEFPTAQVIVAGKGERRQRQAATTRQVDKAAEAAHTHTTTPARGNPEEAAKEAATEAVAAPEETTNDGEIKAFVPEERTLQAEGAAVPLEKTPSAADKKLIVSEETTEAVEETTAIAEETTEAVEETTAIAEETTTAVEETTTAVEETTTAVEETTSAVEETTTAVEETTSAVEETTTAVEETTTAIEETTSAVEETTTAVEETTTAVEETTTAEEETTTAVQETTTAAEETTTAAEETTTAVEETTTAVEETTTAVEETTTAAEETTSAVEETTTAIKETTSAVEETTAAEIETTIISDATSYEETTTVSVITSFAAEGIFVSGETTVTGNETTVISNATSFEESTVTSVETTVPVEETTALEEITGVPDSEALVGELAISVEALEDRIDAFNDSVVELERKVAALDSRVEDDATEVASPVPVEGDVSEETTTSPVPVEISISKYFVYENASYIVIKADENTDVNVAQTACESRKYYLTEVNNQGELQAISDEIAPHIIEDALVLVSGQKTVDQDVWLYQGTQEQVDFLAWGPGEPVQSPDSECLALRKSSDHLNMVTVPCSSGSPNFFILCEHKD